MLRESTLNWHRMYSRNVLVKLIVLSQSSYFAVVLRCRILSFQKLLIISKYNHLNELDSGLAQSILQDIVDITSIVHILAIGVLLIEGRRDHQRVAQVRLLTEHTAEVLIVVVGQRQSNPIKRISHVTSVLY